MKLKYITPPLDAGGSAVPGCGTIHISEIEPTLTKLSDDLEFPFDLNDYILGSTGKREYSGDIDLVLDESWYGNGHKAFHAELVELFGRENTARNGEMVHLKYPIQNYNSSLQDMQPRTGFVQVDFNFGDPNWERVYHYAPGDSSEYKGAHRNLAIAAIASIVDKTTSDILDLYDRPVSQIRWKWGPKGLIKVNRHSILDSETNQWFRKQIDENVEGPIYDADQIARILFPEDGTADDLHSLETIMAAVKRNYGMADCERIWKRMAHNFSEWKDGKNFVYPSEITPYFQSNDK